MGLLLDNRFDVLAPIGEGGMGIVFGGKDRATGRPVAIKTLRADHAESTALEQFQREAEVLRQLNHPNIVQVLATIEQDARTYIVMEFVEGGSLASRLRRDHPLPLNQVLSVALDVADALTRVHRLGILHRDLKPENVLLAADGSARLSDFGIAHFAGTDTSTADGGIHGTLQYLSPEAISGEPLDTRSDVWAFGIVLFEMLAGHPPFGGDLMPRVMMSIMTDRVPDLEALRPDAPVALIDLVYRMLEKDVSARLRSVRVAGAELEALFDPSAVTESSLGRTIERSAKSVFTPASSTRRGPVHNLPSQPAPLIGRSREMEEIERLLVRARVLTIVGAGGSGKTRFAQEVGFRQLENNRPSVSGDPVSQSLDPRFRGDDYRDGIFLVSLAPLRAVEEIVTAIGDAVGLAFVAGLPRDHQLSEWLKNRNVLLLLDNFEHLLDGASLVTTLVDGAPRLTIVCTSREPLGLSSETLFRLEGIDVPPQRTSPEMLATFGAVDLFLQSARRAFPAFKPDDNDFDAIATITRVVGGSPLAIVMAASWVEVLRPAEILEEIRRNLDFLETSARDTDERHRSMRVVFDAAWERLSSEEQAQFAGISVFRGGFTREAAQQVIGASLRSLANLVRHSLLRRDPISGRYDVHELLRQYAEGRLVDRDEAERQHGAHYASMLANAEDRLGGTERSKTMSEIDAEFDNIRAAWDNAVRRRDLPVIARSLTTLASFYGLRTMNEEAVARLGAALEMVRAISDDQRPADLELGLQVRSTAALMNLKGYAHPEVGTGFSRARELCDRLGPSPLLAPVMFGLWAFYLISGEHATARGLATQLLDIGLSSGDPVLEMGGHHASSGSCACAGDLEAAERHAKRVMELYRPEHDPQVIAFVNDHSASAARGWQAVALTAMGRLDEARVIENDVRAFNEQLGHGQTHAQMYLFLHISAWIRRDFEAAAEIMREMQSVGMRYSLPVYAMLGGAFVATDTATSATIESLVESGHVIQNMFGFKAICVASIATRRAELLLEAGDIRAARIAVEQGLDWMREKGEGLFESEAFRVRGDVERAEGNNAAAEVSYRSAIALAASQKARLFEQRAADSLAALR